MKLTIKNQENNIQISHDEEVKFDFDLENTVDLTEFIKFFSESNEPIQCEPDSFEQFISEAPDTQEENLKLVEYIFKTITAFNESYSEIYESEEEDTENPDNG